MLFIFVYSTLLASTSAWSRQCRVNKRHSRQGPLGAEPGVAAEPSLDRRQVLSTFGALGTLAATGVARPSPAGAASQDIFRPAAGSLTGKTILITGANTGLGLESAKRLAGAGATVVATARTQAKAEKAVAAVEAAVPGAKAVGAELDLARLESVKTFPGRLQKALNSASPPHIDVLLNNAGVMAIPERAETSDGFERTVGVNHLGHFALVAALLPALQRAPQGFRVVTVSSDAHRFVDSKTMRAALANDLAASGQGYPYSAWGSYGVSKAANVLFTLELERRLAANPGLKGSAVTLHPGVVQTDLARYIVGGMPAEDTRLSETAPPPASAFDKFMKAALDNVLLTPEAGANTQVYLSSGADLPPGAGLGDLPGGLFYDKMRPVDATGTARDPVLAAQLWELSEKLTGMEMQI